MHVYYTAVIPTVLVHRSRTIYIIRGVQGLVASALFDGIRSILHRKIHMRMAVSIK